MKLTINIKSRLIIWFLVIIIAILVFWGAVAQLLMTRSLLQKNINLNNVRITRLKEEDGIASAISYTDIIGLPESVGEMPVLSLSYTLEQLKEFSSENVFIDVVMPEGSLAIDTRSLIIDDLPENTHLWLYLYPDQNEPYLYNLVTVCQTNVEGVIGIFVRTLWLTIPIALVFAGVFGYFLVNKMLKPVQTITETAQEIESSNLSSRIAVRSNDEIGKLSATLNRMFERLENAFNREKQFTTDASHELGTPLSIIQGEAELALHGTRSNEEYQKALESILKETRHMSSATRKLLFLSRDDGNQQLQLEDLDLRFLLDDFVQDAEVLCHIKDIAIQFNILSNPRIRGDKVQLRELFLNLIDNAIRYTPQNGEISITLGEQEDYAYVSIKDTGTGISKEHLPYLFERFYRADRSRASRSNGSAGLGLAICKKIAELHSGKIDVESEKGKGSIFTVWLPTI